MSDKFDRVKFKYDFNIEVMINGVKYTFGKDGGANLDIACKTPDIRY